MSVIKRKLMMNDDDGDVVIYIGRKEINCLIHSLIHKSASTDRWRVGKLFDVSVCVDRTLEAWRRRV